jgi:hypothetical protein
MTNSEQNGVSQIPHESKPESPIREVACITCGRRIWNMGKPLESKDIEEFLKAHKKHQIETSEYALPPVVRGLLPIP